MKKALKLALEIDQVEYKENVKNVDGYEIHLHGDTRDDFSLLETLTKPVFTFHYPLKKCDCLDIAKEFESEYSAKVFEMCKKYDAGLVIHTESSAHDILKDYRFDKFCDTIKDLGLHVHVENTYANAGSLDTLQVVRYMQKRIDDEHVHPLLDTCHLMMSEMSFKYEELSFYKAMDAFKSDRFVIHLNDCIGSGERETGGTHGTNFSNNLYLLRNILWRLKEIKEHENLDCVCVLEVDEKDYVKVPAARELARNIDVIVKEFEDNY